MAAVFAMVLLIQTGIWYGSAHETKFITKRIEESFYYQGNILNMYFVAYLILNSLWIHLPILIAIVTGDLIAGEANSGTFRVLLSRPISRLNLITAKFIAGVIYSTFIVILLAVLSLVVGRFVFGTGDLIVFRNTINVFDVSDVMWRFIAAYGFGILSMAVVTSLSFFLSNFANNSIGPIMATIIIIIVFQIIGVVDITIFNAIKPYLFTHYIGNWQLFFDYEMNYFTLYKSLIILVLHIVALFSATAYIFNRKDILS